MAGSTKRVLPDKRTGAPLSPTVGPTRGPNPKGAHPSAPKAPRGTGRKGR